MVPHPEYNEQKEDLDLKLFLDSILERFFSNDDIYNFRGALVDRLKNVSSEEKPVLLQLAKKHLIWSTCHLHKKEVSIPRHKNFDQILTEENIDDFLLNEGIESVKEHIRILMPKEWVMFLRKEADRLSEYKLEEAYNSTPG